MHPWVPVRVSPICESIRKFKPSLNRALSEPLSLALGRHSIRPEYRPESRPENNIPYP